MMSWDANLVTWLRCKLGQHWWMRDCKRPLKSGPGAMVYPV